MYHQNTFTPATANARVRTLWLSFEKSQEKDLAQLNITVQMALKKADATWNKVPNKDRMGQRKHLATKTSLAKGIKATYFEKARAKWDDSLGRAGLKAEYWTDLTEDEKRRISIHLGADHESDEEAVVVTELPQAPIVQPPFFQPLTHSISTSSHATSFSSTSYAFVNPSEFNSEEEDFDIPFSNPVVTSVDLTSEEDDDVALSIPGYPTSTRPSFVGSAFSRAYSLQNSASNPSKPPSARPLGSGFAYNAAPSGAVPTKRPQPSQNEDKTLPNKPRMPPQPYVGPSLDAPDEPINEELDFEKFKMRTRMEKIAEFHEAAALAEISLAIGIYKARKQLNNSKEEDAPRVLEHQKRMVQLQKEKEEQRKAIVKSERARRQSDLGHRSTQRDVKGPPMSTDTFKPWLSSFQEELDLPSRFNLDNLANQQTNVQSLLSEMFPDDYQSHSGPEVSSAALFNSYPSAPSNQDAFRGSASIHHSPEQLHQSHPWNKPQSNPSPKPRRKAHLSPFGESSDEEDDAPAAVRNWNDNTGWDINKPDAKPMTPIWNHKPNGSIDNPDATPVWNNKPNAPTPAVRSAWSSKHVRTASVGSTWSSKDAAAPITQPRQCSSFWSTNPSFVADEIEPEPTATPVMKSKAAKGINPLFVADEIEPEPTATLVMNSKAAKGKKPWASASENSPPTVETTTSSSQAPAAENPAVPPNPALASAPTPAPVPVSKKQNKKQRQANKKGGAATVPAEAAAAAIQKQEPETEAVLPQRESPKLETPAPNPASQSFKHMSWASKTAPAMARARMDSGPTTPFNWDEFASTPRPASNIPAHLQETFKSEGTPRPNLHKNQQSLMTEAFSAAASRTALEHMPPPPIAKGPVWGSAVTAPSPGPSLWGKTKADFETPKVAQQPGSNTWLSGGFDGIDNYNDEGVGGDGGGGGGGGGDEDTGVGLWESMAAHPKQVGKAAPIPAKQQQSSVAAQRPRWASEAASSSGPRVLSIKDQLNIAQAAPPAVNSNSKKARGKKTGKGKQRATVEDVSDEEKDNIDCLPQDADHIMESKVIVEPKPSVLPSAYSSIIDFADDDANDNGYSSTSFRPSASMAPSSSPDGLFSHQSRLPTAFKTQAAKPSVGADWGASGGQHARWTPSVGHDGEESGPPSYLASFGPPTKPSVQQTPVWGQPTKDKGKGKRMV